MKDFLRQNAGGVMVVMAVLPALVGCAFFEALAGDPTALASAQTTAGLLIPPPWNLIVPGAFGIFSALVTPKDTP